MSNAPNGKPRPRPAWGVLGLVIAVGLAPVALWYGGEYYFRWRYRKITREVRAAGGTIGTHARSFMYGVHVFGKDEEATAALKVLAKYGVPKTLRFDETRYEDPAHIYRGPWRAAITDRTLEYVGRMTWLESLYLGGNQISDEGLKHLANLRKLRELNLLCTNVSDKGLEHLAGLQSLQNITVTGTAVTALGLEELAGQIPGLRGSLLSDVEEEIVRLRKNVQIRFDDTLARPMLERLIEHRLPTHDMSLEGPRVTRHSFELVTRHMTWLENLFLEEVSLSNDDLQLLRHQRQLQTLRLIGVPITDDGLKHLAHLHNLRSLGLWRTKVTDDGLKHLVGLKSLKSVATYKSPITANGVEWLMQQIPSLDNEPMHAYLEQMRKQEAERQPQEASQPDQPTEQPVKRESAENGQAGNAR